MRVRLHHPGQVVAHDGSPLWAVQSSKAKQLLSDSIPSELVRKGSNDPAVFCDLGEGSQALPSGG
jgi:hypothetical protein